jgi:hypothetical protein
MSESFDVNMSFLAQWFLRETILNNYTLLLHVSNYLPFEEYFTLHLKDFEFLPPRN